MPLTRAGIVLLLFVVATAFMRSHTFTQYAIDRTDPAGHVSGAEKANPAVVAEPRNEDWWHARHSTLNERTRQGGIDLLFIGDSLMQDWEGQGREVWVKRYAPRKAANLGIAGDMTQHVLWRLDHGNVDGIGPKAAVVMIGTNNLAVMLSPDQIAAGVKAITDKLGEKLPTTKVLLLAIFPRGEKPNSQRENIAATNLLLAKLADGRRITYLDIGQKFVGTDGTILRKTMPDFLHLSAMGYAIWADAIEDNLRSLLGEN